MKWLVSIWTVTLGWNQLYNYLSKEKNSSTRKHQRLSTALTTNRFCQPGYFAVRKYAQSSFNDIKTIHMTCAKLTAKTVGKYQLMS